MRDRENAAAMRAPVLRLDSEGARPEPSAGSELSPLQVALHWKWRTLGFALVVAGLASVYVSRLPARYGAEAAIEVDPRQVRVLQADNLLSNVTADAEQLRTQMEGLRSPRLALSVVNTLRLQDNPEFCALPAPAGVLARARGWYEHFVLGRMPAPPSGCSVTPEKAAEQLLGMVSGFTDGRSRIIRVSAEAADPELAARIANAYAEAFIDRQVQEKREVSRQVSAFLSNYLWNLRTQVEAAEAAVAAYRDTHSLVALRGETLTGQALGDVNTALTQLNSEISQKQSTLDELRKLLTRGGSIDASAPVLASPAIQGLAAREAEQSAVLAQLRVRFGDSHPQYLAAVAQLDKVRQQIRAEIGKLVTAMGTDLQALNARKAMVTSQLRDLQSNLGEQGRDSVHLQELQRDADAQRQLYQNMLTRLKQIDAEQGIQHSDMRLLIEAQPSSVAVYPRKSMMVSGAFLTALMAGTGLAFVANTRARRFRDASHAEEATGLTVLGLFMKPPRGVRPAEVPVERPLSLQAEALYAILARLTGPLAPSHDRGRVIMITSALPNEGKTSFAIALGRAAARSGLSTVLIDGDLRRPSVTQVMTGRPSKRRDVVPHTREGIEELFGEAAVDPRSGLHALPLTGCMPDPHQLLVSPLVPSVVKYLQSRYDLILIDTPPVLVVSDALNISPLADEIIMVMDWEHTPRDAVVSSVQTFRRHGVTITGLVAGKVDTGKASDAFDGFGYRERAYRDYAALPAA